MWGSVFSRSFLRRLEKLERAAGVEDKDEIVDGMLWDCEGGGLWGHHHVIIHSKGQRTEFVPCSVDEEIWLMRNIFEGFNRRLFGQGEEVSFPDFLEHFDYLGPESFADQRKATIQKLREEANGAK